MAREFLSGVSLVLYVDDAPVEPREDGYIGKLSPMNTSRLEITIEPELDVYGFTVEGRKNSAERLIHLKKNHAIELGKEGRVYKQVMTMIQPADICYPRPGQNEIRLLEVGAQGLFRLWEIALVSQGGEFFLTIQAPYGAVWCYRDAKLKNRLVCPTFAEWSELLAWLEQIYSEYLDDLPYIDTYRGQSQDTTAKSTEKKLDDHTACIIWWNKRDGRGMAAVTNKVSPNGVAVLHWSNCAPRTENGFVFFENDELVHFEAVRSPHETRKRATGFKIELVGVRVIAST